MATATSRWDFDKVLNQLLVVVAIGVLGHTIYMFTTNDLENIRQMVSFKPIWFLVAYLCMWLIWVSHGTEIWIWSLLFKRNLGFHNAFKIAMATDLGVAATPTFVGGGPIKVSMLVRKEFKLDEAATVLAMNPISDVLFHLIFIPTSIIVAGKYYDASWIMDYLQRDTIFKTIGIAAAVVLVITLVRKYYKRKLGIEQPVSEKQSWQDKLKSFIHAMSGNFRFILKEGKGHYLLAFLFNSMKWVMRYLALMAVLLAMGVETNYVVIFFFQWIIYISMMFIPTPGAAVGAEASFLFVFKSVIPAGDVIKGAMIGWRMLTYYIMLISAAFYLLIVRWKTGKII